MGNFVPKCLTDDDWYRILNTTDSVSDRVSFLEYTAVKQRREERDKMKRNSKSVEFSAKLDEERAKFERGEMGYGPDLYQLIHNPMRNRKKIHITQGARVLATLRCNEAPKIAFDLQHMFDQKPRVQSELGNQMQYVISENLDSRIPLHLTFVNFPETQEAQDWLNRCVGFYGGQYTHQTVLPDFTSKGVKEVFPDENIVYISRHAREMLDGPLNVGAIALCVSMDTAREALGAARRGRMRAVRLPIQKYVKWQKGPMYLPFPNVVRIFREVHQSGGDWESALINNISKRHLVTPEEQEEQVQIERANRRKIRLREKDELIRTIREATGHL
ncbi:putative tRNA (Guanine-N(1)-)-methyltransferase [Trichostrongylus colubriformis]|uniref:tRNA (Guanine-N(1)-)-methyltransferase n=1 Tax=Trichostrongylus colubriformis TaxID=6319 RepID=A0AAN8FQF1_TRICO